MGIPTLRAAPSMVYNVGMSRVKHVARIAAGYALLVVGVIGLFVPILQGTLMILAGAALLGWDLKWIRDARDRIVAWWRGGR